MTKRSNKKERNKSIPAHSSKGQHSVQQATLAIHEGPLPTPDLLAGYDDIVPGAAERIITMAEEQERHRHDLEKIVVKAGARDSLLGLIFGLIIGMTTILGGTYSVVSGHPTEGTILGGAGLVSLVGVFVYGSHQRRSERKAKATQ
ncbi:MAG: DUF2335 domain-containing protein [Pseudomonadota bacterium]